VADHQFGYITKLKKIKKIKNKTNKNPTKRKKIMLQKKVFQLYFFFFSLSLSLSLTI